MVAATTTIRVSRETHKKLNELVRMSGRSTQEVVDDALELYRREQLLKAINDAYAVLRETPEAWNELENERVEWDLTLNDGLERE
jgi:predicted transcriptional regulator